jgi:ribonuclease P protein component
VKIYTLGKTERIKSRSVFDLLFEQGKNIRLGLINTTFLTRDFQEEAPIQAAFIVPKKKFKKAFERNKIRRRMKEAYRKNKAILYDHAESSLTGYYIAFIYNGQQIANYKEIEEKIIVILQRLTQAQHKV